MRAHNDNTGVGKWDRHECRHITVTHTPSCGRVIKLTFDTGTNLVWLISLAISILGCNESDRDSGTVFSDSAGVVIVENRAPQWSNADAWHVGALVLDIGGLEDPDYEFESIVNAVRIAGDRIAVADAGALNIRIYDSLGSFLELGGRKGEGPGEFKSVSGMIGYHGDSLAVYDAGTRRISLFDSDLAFGRSITITPPDETPGVAPVGVFADGSWLLSGLPFGSFMLNRSPSGLARVGLVLFRYDPDVHKADRLREAPGMELHVWSEGGGIPQTSLPMFYRTSDAGMYRDGYYLVSSDTYELRFYDDDNRLVRVVRKFGVRQDVTTAATVKPSRPARCYNKWRTSGHHHPSLPLHESPRGLRPR